MKTLGLDIGTNSIGWGIVDGYWLRNETSFYFKSSQEHPIIDYGIRIFPVSLDPKTQSQSLASKRREFRSVRRMYDRRRRRKINLLRILSAHGLCPRINEEELKQWKYTQKFPKTNQALIDWLCMTEQSKPLQNKEQTNPYYLRAKAVKEQLEPYELGRVLYHLAVRRGFLSNKKTEGAIKDGDVLKSISKITDEIKNANKQTMGEYFYSKYNEILEQENKLKHYRIRNQYTDRITHYHQEFDVICEKQNMKEELKKQLFRAIYFQRPLKSQKQSVGKCTLEPTRTRCPISHPMFELFRAYQLLNNIKVIENKEKRPLSQKEKDLIEPMLFKAKDSKMSDILKSLQKNNSNVNINYGLKTTVKNCPTLYKIMNALKEKKKPKINTLQKLYDTLDKLSYGEYARKSSEQKLSELWHELYYAQFKTGKSEEEVNTDITKWILAKYNIEEDVAHGIAKIDLGAGYSKLSYNAIKNILIFLKQDIGYTESVFLAKIPKIFSSVWNEKSQEIINDVLETIKSHEVHAIAINITNDYIAKTKSGECTLLEKKTIQEKIQQHIQSRYLTSHQSDALYNEVDNIIQICRDVYTMFCEGHIQSIKFETQKPLEDEIKTYIVNKLTNLGIQKDTIKKSIDLMYHPSKIDFSTLPDPNQNPNSNQKIISNKTVFFHAPDPKTIRNPIYLRAIHQVRKLIIALIEQEKIDKNTTIIIEMAREVNSIDGKSAITIWQHTQQEKRAKAKKTIKDYYKDETYVPTADEIRKVLLWEEQGKFCMYTGDTISIVDFLGKNPLYDIEHTIPQSLFFDDAMTNLTLCRKDFNRDIKKGKLPSELNNYQEILGRVNAQYKFDTNIESLEKTIKKSAYSENKVNRHLSMLKLKYLQNKQKSFTISRQELEDKKNKFAAYQLPTTQMITSHVRRYLQIYFKKVHSVEGKTTALLRKSWCGNDNNNASEDDLGYEIKDRSFHSHHAKDSIIIALAQRNIFNELSKTRKKDENFFYNKKINFKPWENFKRDIDTIGESVLPSIDAPHKYFKNTKKKLRSKSGKILRNSEGHILYQRGKSVRVELHEQLKPRKKTMEQVRVRENTFSTDNEENKYAWAKSGTGSNYIGLIFKNENNNKKFLEIINVWDTIKHIEPKTEIKRKGETYYLFQKLKIKQKVLFYQHSKDEIASLIEQKKFSDLQQRLYTILVLKKDNRIELRKSISARTEAEYISKIPWDDTIRNCNHLLISHSNWNFICEGVDFTLDILGNITLI